MNDYMFLRRLTLMAVLAYGAFVAWAMPTKTELTQAQQLVQDLTAEALRAMKAGTKTPEEVAAAQLALADEAETEAGKYLLLQGAFRIYARSGNYDSAADVLQRMRGEIADLPPEVIVEIVNNEMRRVAAEKAPKVLAIFRDAQRTMKCRKELKTAEAAAKAKPDDKAVQRRLAECHVGLGDWPKALEIFAKIGDEAAKFEQDTASAKGFDAMKTANYWWEYAAKDAEPFKAHAAALYKKGLADGSITGLRKTLAEKRIKEMEGVMTVAPAGAQASKGATAASKWTIPANFKTPLVRTLKLADGVTMDFCAVPAGSFQMSYPWGSEKDKQGQTHKVTITRPFWFSKTLVTTKQYRLFNSIPRERDSVCKDLEAKFPDFDVVHGVAGADVDSCIEHINQKFGYLLPQGYVFRLPTEAEWEHAYGGGNGNGTKDIGQFKAKEETARVLGKYDLKGNSGCRLIPRNIANGLGIIGGPTDEFQPVLDCIDRRDGVTENISARKHYDYDDYEIDPIRMGKLRIDRRGARGRSIQPNTDGIFRLVIGPDLVAEKKAMEVGKTDSTPVHAPPTVHSAQNTTQSAQIKTHTVKLNSTVSMEFVECPAGTFMMGKDTPPYRKTTGEKGANVMRHQVTITRPFWIGKYLVTREEWGVYRPKDALKKDLNALERAIGGLKAPRCNVSYDDAMKFCTYLTKKYGAMIPKGYVFRLPSEAEWEYALRANAADMPDNPYGGASAHPKSGDDIRDLGSDQSLREELEKKGFKFDNDNKCILGGKTISVPPPAAGRKIPNSWGLYSMVGPKQWMLDTVKANTMLDYAANETDPLRQYGKNDVRAIVRGELWWTWMVKGFLRLDARNGHSLCIRLVVGPDLIAEKRAGNGKR